MFLICLLTSFSIEPAKPALPKARGGIYSVNVTFEYGVGGGYPEYFIVKYREKSKMNSLLLRRKSRLFEF